MFALWSLCFSPIYAQEKLLDIIGETKTFVSNKTVTGVEKGSPITASRSGKDFHILILGLPVDQTVELELGFAELEHSTAGSRIFDLFVNDKPALQQFDIFKDAGGALKPALKKFTITPSRGFLDFHFVSQIGEASINYIRVKGDKVSRLITVPELAKPEQPYVPDEHYIPLDEQAPFDVETGVLHLDDSVKTWTNGVPLGGIGTGKFEILPNGQFANFTINNSWDLPVLQPRGTFLAVAAKAVSGRGIAKILQVNPADSNGKETYIDHLKMKEADYVGQFPFSDIKFKDDQLPIKVSVNSWSPVIPYNLGDSSLPAAIVNVVLENQKNYPIATAVALSWEDINGRGGSLLPGDQYGFAGQSVHQDSATSSITGIQINTGYTQNNRQATFTGNYFVGTPIKGAAVSRKLNWNPMTASIPWWKQFTSKLRLDRIPSTPASAKTDAKSGPMASTICVSVNLAPNEVRRIPFVVSWYFPKVVTVDPAQGEPSVETLDYASQFGSSAGVASYVAQNRSTLRKETDEWYDLVTRSTVPKWVVSHILNSLFPVKTNSVLLKDQRFAMLESPADMKGMLGSVDLRMASGDFLRSLFPDLEKRELNLYGRAQDSSGRIPRYIGNIHGALGGFDANLLGNDWLDPTATWLLQMAIYSRETGDKEFVNSSKDNITKARDYLINHIKLADRDFKSNVFSASDQSPAVDQQTQFHIVAAIRAAQDLLDDTTPSILDLIAELSTQIKISETTSTYAAMLSGETALRNAALPGFLSREAQTDYFNRIKTQNFSTKPVPLMEASDSSIVPADALSFPASLQAYIGPLAMNLGLTDIGLEPYVRMFQIAYAAQKNPWKQALRYDVPTGAKSVFRYHRSAMGAWSLMRGLSGVVHDVEGQRLYINPHTINSVEADMEIPVFAPSFWGWLKYHQKDSTGTLAIIKTNPGFTTQTISSVATGLSPDNTAQNLIDFVVPFVIEEGATIEFEGWPGRGGTVTPQKPVVVPDDLEADDTTTSTTGSQSTGTTTMTSREIEQGEEMPPTREPDSLE